MATRRNALGRGLGALIPTRTEEPAEAPTPISDASEGASERSASGEIPIDRIAANPDQPRRRFDDEQLESLASSIRQHGVLQPVVVRRSANDDERYELIVGERRWRAARRAGRKTIPAVVADLAPRERLEVALVENVQRHDLNAIELAQAFRTLADSGATQEEIGERVGLDRSTVANHLRLLDLSRELQEDVEFGRLSVGHAKALLSVANPERRSFLRRKILNDGISVRETERLGRTVVAPTSARKKRRAEEPADPDQARLLDLLRDRLKTRVRIVGGAGRGRIEVEYFGAEDLNRVAMAILDGQ